MATTTAKKPRRKKLRLRRLIGAVLLVCVSISAVFLCIQIERNIYAKNKELELKQQQIAEEQQKQLQLKEAEKQTQSDEYYEKIAREKLGLVNVNEQVFVDISKKNSAE